MIVAAQAGGDGTLYGIAAIMSAVAAVVAAFRASTKANETKGEVKTNTEVIKQVDKRADMLTSRTDALAQRTGALDELNRTIVEQQAQMVALVTSTSEQLRLSTDALVKSEARNMECERREAQHLRDIEALTVELAGVKNSLTRVERVVERINPDVFRPSP